MRLRARCLWFSAYRMTSPPATTAPLTLDIARVVAGCNRVFRTNGAVAAVNVQFTATSIL